MMKKVVIVGGCVAAKEAANTIRRLDSSCSITMISEENNLPYYRPMLSRAISLDVFTSRFYLAPESWYKENNIDLLLNTKITKVIPENNLVVDDNANTYEYTHLLLATGATNFIPIPHALDINGVFSIRTYDDVIHMRSHLSKCKKAVIVGGGLLGLEAAWELHQNDIDVTIVESAPYLLPQQLDPETSEFFTSYLKSKGIKILCGAAVTDIITSEEVESVACTNGQSLPCDLILFSVGAHPNIELTKGSGIATDRGILVDQYMRTNIPNIYAAGDVTQNMYRTSGIWLPAMEMGKIAGSNIADTTATYQPTTISTMLNAFDTKLFSIGNVAIGDDVTTKTIVDTEKNILKKLFAKNNVLIGAILIEDIRVGTRLIKRIGEISLEEAQNMIE